MIDKRDDVKTTPGKSKTILEDNKLVYPLSVIMEQYQEQYGNFEGKEMD